MHSSVVGGPSEVKPMDGGAFRVDTLDTIATAAHLMSSPNGRSDCNVRA
jgi:hypothetical protein